jgi:hypothetical protein
MLNCRRINAFHLRIFDDRTKAPQVFRNPGGSPLLKIAGLQTAC